jgi:hypothetical protein
MNILLKISGDYFHLGETVNFLKLNPQKAIRNQFYNKIDLHEFESEAFKRGIIEARKSFSYRLGNVLLTPYKVVKNLFK